MVCRPIAGWTLGRGEFGPTGYLRNSAQFPASLCNLRENLSLHTRRCLRRLHAWLLRYCRVFDHEYGCVRYWFLLPTLCWYLLVWSALHIRGRSCFHLEFRHGVESHDRGRLHLWLSLLLSLV